MKLSQLMRHLVTDNPMKIEVSRFRRKYLSPNSSSAVTVILVLCVLGYLSLLFAAVSFPQAFSTWSLLNLELVLMCFFIPMTLHGTICSERERRSWDLLRVAPITAGQIVSGKWLSGVFLVGVLVVAMQLPIWINLAQMNIEAMISMIRAQIIVGLYGMLLCAWTIFVSARVNRPFTAFGVSLGSIIIVFMFVPLLASSLTGSIEASLINFLNPFYYINGLHPEAMRDGTRLVSPNDFAVIFAYVFLTVVLLIYAEKTLHFPESDVKFLPQGKKDA